MRTDEQRTTPRAISAVCGGRHDGATTLPRPTPARRDSWNWDACSGRELSELGLADVRHDEYGLVLATLPPTVDADVPVVAFNAHLDTSPETSGAHVRPQVIRNYAGGDLVLPGDPSQVIRVADNPELEQLRGATLITSDGTTLLGADDKAGVAIIMEVAAYLTEHPEVPHGPCGSSSRAMRKSATAWIMSTCNSSPHTSAIPSMEPGPTRLTWRRSRRTWPP